MSPAHGNRIRQTALAIFLLLSFLFTSRLVNVIGKSFKLPTALLLLLALTLVLSGRGLVFWKTAAGKTVPVFAAWVLLTYFLTPHSAGSLDCLEAVLEGVILFAAAAGLLATAADFSKLFVTLAAGGLAAAALGIVWSAFSNGRLALRGGPYADPNYYAMWLLALAPIVWTALARPALWTKICAALAAALLLVLAVRTGSRAGFVAMAMMLVVVVCFSSLTTRILVGSVAAVAAVALIAFVPNVLKTRLDASSETRGADETSLDARQTLFRTSLVLTALNPLFGVGPDNFPSTVVEEGRAQGKEWLPLETHNSYTQISSETGVPGIVLYLLLIGLSLKNIVSLLRQVSPRGATPDAEICPLARGFLLSLAAVLSCMFFLSEGYSYMLFLWLGLAAGIRMLRAEPEEEEYVNATAEELAPR